MNADHRGIRERLGAFAIGALDEPERSAVERHLATCAGCRAELARLGRVAERLTMLRDEGAPQAGPAPDGADRLFARLALERRRDRRRRVAVAAGAVAAAVVALAVLVLPVGGPSTPDQPAAQAVAFTQVPVGVTASAELRDWGWGTQMRLHITGLPEDQQLAVWLEQPDGTRVSAGSFRTTGGELTMMMGAGANTGGSVALEIGDPEGETLLRAPLPDA